MIIGLTGVSGAGKTTVSQIFEKNGFFVINCDQFVHENVYRDPVVLKKIAAMFGTQTVKNGKLDRAALRNIVFKNESEINRLNRFILPVIKERMIPVLDARRDQKILLDAPTLFQSGMDQTCDLTVGVLADKKILFQRLSKRDGLSNAEIEDRLKNQYGADFFEKNCDCVIYNNGSPTELESQVKRIIAIIDEKAL